MSALSIASSSPITFSPVGTRHLERVNMQPAERLFQDLDKELRRDPNGANVISIMKEYLSTHDDWQDYMNFNEHKYARNLIGSNDMLELMVICWLPGQVSPVHNHAGQHCWAAVLEGVVEETHFHFSSTHSPFGEGPLEAVDVHQVSAGDVSYITDDIALHVLKPANDKRVATLHCYSKPIAECNIYCPCHGTITKRKLGFYTVNKRLQDMYDACGGSK
ncbi:cysteine dioxygenase [Planoprotostelium fungivorum]|uniref:Cysteine dioxygenase n=1 Tax=Planoprotostelium fungivorum TaxID=1890364 RepID=A0A2P6NQ70_9EUKA|nr:cysteine dioxygenase [Planoprotostelium fungivorum]